MYSQIIGTQQIVVTAVFLAVMIVVLIILRRKGGAIRASLKAGKRISVVEDTAVSPTERLRLISIDHSEFVMLSAKGQQPVLMPITSVKPAPASAGTPPASMGLADIDESPGDSSISASPIDAGGVPADAGAGLTDVSGIKTGCWPFADSITNSL